MPYYIILYYALYGTFIIHYISYWNILHDVLSLYLLLYFYTIVLYIMTCFIIYIIFFYNIIIVTLYYITLQHNHN